MFFFLLPAPNDFNNETSATVKTCWHLWTQWTTVWMNAGDALFWYLLPFMNHFLVSVRSSLSDAGVPKRTIDRPYQRADTGTRGIQCNLCLSDVAFVPSPCSSAHYRPSSSTETVLSASRLSCLTVILFSPQPHSLLPPSLLLPVFCRQLLTCLSSTQPPWLVFMTTGAYLSQWNAVAFWDAAAVPR